MHLLGIVFYGEMECKLVNVVKEAKKMYNLLLGDFKFVRFGGKDTFFLGRHRLIFHSVCRRIQERYSSWGMARLFTSNEVSPSCMKANARITSSQDLTLLPQPIRPLTDNRIWLMYWTMHGLFPI
jgi:hypothetical protein